MFGIVLLAEFQDRAELLVLLADVASELPPASSSELRLLLLHMLIHGEAPNLLSPRFARALPPLIVVDEEKQLESCHSDKNVIVIKGCADQAMINVSTRNALRIILSRSGHWKSQNALSTTSKTVYIKTASHFTVGSCKSEERTKPHATPLKVESQTLTRVRRRAIDCDA